MPTRGLLFALSLAAGLAFAAALGAAGLADDFTGTPGDDVLTGTNRADTFTGDAGNDRIDAREVATSIGSIPWEILCRVGSRIERVYT